MNKKIDSSNYLEHVLIQNPKFEYEISAKGKVTIFKENKGLMNKIFQILFFKPKISQIHLDDMGNFIWPLLDGKRNVLEIADAVKEKFGDECEPLYDRLVKYLKILESYEFIIDITTKKESL